MTSERSRVDPEELPTLVLPLKARDHLRGTSEARYQLVEYGDFESEHCYHLEPILAELRRELGDDLCFAFRNFPLPAEHPNAQAAAEAAEAADMQGKYWLMHERMFAHRSELSEALYLQLARELPIDLHDFERDLRSGAAARRVAEDVETGRAAGVGETPTLFVNGRLHLRSYEFLPLLRALQATP